MIALNVPNRRLLRYMGAKNAIANWVLGHFPRHESYVEPFFGSGAIFFNKERSKIETVSDLNGNVINFFEVLRDDRDELIRQCELTPYSMGEFEKTPILFEPMDEVNLTPLERARLFYVWSWMAFYPHTGRAKQPMAIHKGSSMPDFTNLQPLFFAAQRLRGVQILNEPAGEVLTRFKPGKKNTRDAKKTLFYCDPPYPMLTRDDKNGTYADDMTLAEHEQLCELLLSSGAMVIISSYENDLYNQAFKGWQRIHKNTTKMAKDEDGDAVRAVETLYISPSCGIILGEQTVMFDASLRVGAALP